MHKYKNLSSLLQYDNVNDMPKAKNNNSVPRPPIVVVMGHIDHGKTTLLDYIRKTKVTEKEAGGITQHVSAYKIDIKNRPITFLDTPGHEAFSKIRKRGAKIADIAILVIAVDDKLNIQTEEAFKFIQEAKIPFIIAINKMDKENANSDNIKKQLSEKNVLTEDWGGKIPSINISAKTGQGIDDLIEMIILLADLEDLSAEGGPASGLILESHTDPKRGIAATLIIQNGTLKQGMCITSEDSFSPVRIFEDFTGNPIKEASASSPVKIIGFDKPPKAGAKFESFACKKDVPTLRPQVSEVGIPTSPKASVGTENTESKAIIPIIIKADTIGSTEALEKQINQIFKENEKIKLNILRANIGDINENDIKLASSAEKAIIIGFNIQCPDNIKILAERLNTEVKLFNIIYEAEDWLKEELKKREPKEEIEKIIGKAKIIKIFKDGKTKKIIGGEINSGKIMLGKNIKIFRKDFELGDGKILELKQQQTNKEEVKEGERFGALIQTKVSIAPQDNLEIIEIITE